MELLSEFAAQVLTKEKRIGSGYMIGPRLVLTALHVVLDDVDLHQIPEMLACEVRLNGDVKSVSDVANKIDPEWRVRQGIEVWQSHSQENDCWLPARLVWPNAGDDPGDCDVALLRIDPNVSSVTADQSVRAGPVGKIVRNGDFCECVGYPEFRKRGETEGGFYETTRVDAESAGLDARGEPVEGRTAARRLRVTSDTPDHHDKWRGLSGAAIICNGDLVGVAHDRVTGTHANNVIGYYPLTKVSDTSGFWIESGLTPLSAEAAASTANFDLLHHITDLDRQPECLQFAGFLKNAVPTNVRDAAGPARMVVIRGHAYDELPHCARRLAKLLSMKFPTAGNAYATMPVLNLGQASTSPELRAKALMNSWATKLGSRREDLSDLSIPELEHRIKAWLVASDKPRLALVQHNDRQLTDGCRDVLTKLRNFVAALPDVNPPCLLFILVLAGTKCDVVEGFYDKAMWPEKMDQIKSVVSDDFASLSNTNRLHVMEPPSNVTWGDIEEWLAKLANKRWQPTRASRKLLQTALPDHQFTPMRSVKQKLEAELQMERI